MAMSCIILAKLEVIYAYMGGGGELARISPPPKKIFGKIFPPLQEGHSLANSPPKIRKNVIFPP